MASNRFRAKAERLAGRIGDLMEDLADLMDDAGAPEAASHVRAGRVKVEKAAETAAKEAGEEKPTGAPKPGAGKARSLGEQARQARPGSGKDGGTDEDGEPPARGKGRELGEGLTMEDLYDDDEDDQDAEDDDAPAA